MVVNIENWLFRLAEERECEPEEEKCIGCKYIQCPYWTDYNEEE